MVRIKLLLIAAFVINLAQTQKPASHAPVPKEAEQCPIAEAFCSHGSEQKRHHRLAVEFRYICPRHCLAALLESVAFKYVAVMRELVLGMLVDEVVD